MLLNGVHRASVKRFHGLVLYLYCGKRVYLVDVLYSAKIGIEIIISISIMVVETKTDRIIKICSPK
jgi:hypothetical protein